MGHISHILPYDGDAFGKSHGCGWGCGGRHDDGCGGRRPYPEQMWKVHLMWTMRQSQRMWVVQNPCIIHQWNTFSRWMCGRFVFVGEGGVQTQTMWPSSVGWPTC